MLNLTISFQNPVDRIDRRHEVDRGVVLELSPDLTSPPAAAATDLNDPFDHVRGRSMRAGVRPGGSAREAAEALLLMAAQPLVARLTADPVAPTELSMTEIANLRFENELGTLGFHGGSSPRHWALPAEGEPRLQGELSTSCP
jgi:hypothetical protein